MAQAIADPKELRDFSRELRRFTHQLQQETRRVNSRFIRLESTWRDQEHRRFAEEYRNTLSTIDRFVRVSEDQIRLLDSKAAALEDYLNSR